MAPALFWSIKFERRVKKWPEPKKLLKQKINFFISINYAKEFLNSLHTGVVFSELFSRASNGRRYSRSWNFQLKISLCSVFQHAEFKFHGCSWIWDFRVCIINSRSKWKKVINVKSKMVPQSKFQINFMINWNSKEKFIFEIWQFIAFQI